MDVPDYSVIDLSWQEKCALKRLRVLKSGFFYSENTITNLVHLRFAKRDGLTKSGKFRRYNITLTGKMYLRYKRKSNIKFLVPLTISTISILGTYDIIWIEPLRVLLQWLKTQAISIAESLGTFLQTIF